MKNLFKWLKRNPCKECDFYVPCNNTCVSKKCNSSDPYVRFFDRLFCEPYKCNKEVANRMLESYLTILNKYR